MLSGKLSIIIIFLSFSIIIFANDKEIVEYALENAGFPVNALEYKKDFGVNEEYTNLYADKILNNPLYFFDYRDSVLKCLEKPMIDGYYSDINNIFDLIGIFNEDMIDILHSEIPLDFNKSVSIVSLIPILFFDDSLDYLYRGAIERNLNATAPICSLDAESIFVFLRHIELNTSRMEKLVNEFVEQLQKIYSSGLLSSIDTFIEAGHVIIGSSQDDVYSMDCDFLIDPGGNDYYINQGGVVYPYTKRIKFIADFSGNDTYMSTDSFSVSLGAVNGVSIVYDYQGDDVYRTYNFSQGAAFIGLSMLIDKYGNDYYSSGIFSQGAGAFGKGILIDISGNDVYTGAAYNQGLGFVRGIGMLIDSIGNDTYRSGTFMRHKPLLKDDYLSMGQGFGMGMRPDYAGGLGILFDNEGSDSYYASVFGQGASYWHSIGMLVDQSGNDYYYGAEYLQGAGIHLSVGGLFDNRGDDMYFSRFGPSQGEGHDFGVGILIDDEGDDNYTVSGGQGVGLTNGVGILIDKKGRDNYYTSENIHSGDVTKAREFYGYGLFIDLEEKDFFSHKTDSSIIKIKHIYGIRYDDTVSVNESYPDTFSVDKNMEIEKLFELASMWQVREVIPLVQKARNTLNKRDDAFDYIVNEKMDTQSGLELRAIVSFFESDEDKYGYKLLELLDSRDEQIVKNTLYVIGKITYNDAYNNVKKLTNSNDESIVLNAVHTIGLMEIADALVYLTDIFMKTDNYRLKIEILTALKNQNENYYELFINEFNDNEQLNYALAGYLSSFDEAVELVVKKVDKDFNDYLILYLYTINSHNNTIINELIDVNGSDSPRIKFLKNNINSHIK